MPCKKLKESEIQAHIEQTLQGLWLTGFVSFFHGAVTVNVTGTAHDEYLPDDPQGKTRLRPKTIDALQRQGLNSALIMAKTLNPGITLIVKWPGGSKKQITEVI